MISGHQNNKRIFPESKSRKLFLVLFKKKNTKQDKMLDYHPKIILAFGETISGNEEIFEWLMNNGYTELGALSKAIRGSEEAFKWLMDNGYPHFAAFDSAIDGDKKAYDWLIANEYTFLALFSQACNKRADAINWLNENQLSIFVRVAEKIHGFRDSQQFDYHKIHF